MRTLWIEDVTNKVYSGDTTDDELNKIYERSGYGLRKYIEASPGPKIRIQDPVISNALMDVLEYVIESEADDFAEHCDNPELEKWMEAWMTCENVPPVPIEEFKTENHPFAKALVVRASWNKVEA